MANYEDRLTIDLHGAKETSFFTPGGLLVATGYQRVVIGERGPYIEFSSEQIIKNALYVPDSCVWRLQSTLVFYHEWRSKQDYVKFYYQRKKVGYADYRRGFWYASTFALRLADNLEIVKPSKPISCIGV